MCRFGATLVPATYYPATYYSGATPPGADEERLVCSSPNATGAGLARNANSGRVVQLTISLNNQQFELAGARAATP